ncbi:CG34241 [Drosophila busckii]|uniref:CG34241 n=1 Tax=Drosophila busckii TaxID=30019 RepID=A0A0M5J4G0_DROBS|nr:uncharacterized protein LOC108602692 [Drosophila busckii]ALC45531.1 CG34241 [Drosophila busckii]
MRPIAAELYPHRRATAYYRTPIPRASMQCQQAEHAREALNKRIAPQIVQHQVAHVHPPNSEDMRNMRNAYFS